jgi:hypothetical protein
MVWNRVVSSNDAVQVRRDCSTRIVILRDCGFESAQLSGDLSDDSSSFRNFLDYAARTRDPAAVATADYYSHGASSFPSMLFGDMVDWSGLVRRCSGWYWWQSLWPLLLWIGISHLCDTFWQAFSQSLQYFDYLCHVASGGFTVIRWGQSLKRRFNLFDSHILVMVLVEVAGQAYQEDHFPVQNARGSSADQFSIPEDTGCNLIGSRRLWRSFAGFLGDDGLLPRGFHRLDCRS